MAYLLEIESFLFCQWLKSVKIMLKRKTIISHMLKIFHSGLFTKCRWSCWSPNNLLVYTILLVVSPYFAGSLIGFSHPFWTKIWPFEGLSSRKRNWTRLLFPEHGARCVACDSTSCQVRGKVFERDRTIKTINMEVSINGWFMMMVRYDGLSWKNIDGNYDGNHPLPPRWVL